MRDAFDLNVWCGRAVQEVLVERWLMRSCVNVFGLGLEHVLWTIMDIGRRHFEHSPLPDQLSRAPFHPPTHRRSGQGFGWSATHVSMISNLLL
jgi:hypothetical protein